MDSRAKSKSEKNLCEQSMKVVTNIIRLSSFFLAGRTLGATGKSAKDFSRSDKVPEKEPLVSEVPKSKRSSKCHSRRNPIIMVEPERNESVSVSLVTREEAVDKLASDYIEKMRKQISRVAK